MLKKYIAIIALAALIAASPAFAADMQVQPPAYRQPAARASQPQNCGEYCQRYKSARSTAVLPANIPLSCVNFVQRGRDKMVLTLYRPDGSKLCWRRADGTEVCGLEKVAGAHGGFCFNPQLLPKGIAAMLCNGNATYVIQGEAYAKLRSQGGMKPTEYACMLGKECPNYRGWRPQFAGGG